MRRDSSGEHILYFEAFIQKVREIGILLIAFLPFQRETKVIPIASVFVLSSVGHELM